jgi:N-acetylglucosamine kinase-like BadF-type ATPase
VSGGTLTASVFNQGYVAIDSAKQDSVLFPSVGVNAAGNAVIAFSIAGEDFFPSAGYAALDASNGAGPIVISFPGVAPDDGFTGYFPFGVRVGRWGDYSWATSDEAGNIWMGAEVIPAKSTLETFVPFANWGTFITTVAP